MKIKSCLAAVVLILSAAQIFGLPVSQGSYESNSNFTKSLYSTAPVTSVPQSPTPDIFSDSSNARIAPREQLGAAAFEHSAAAVACTAPNSTTASNSTTSPAPFDSSVQSAANLHDPNSINISDHGHEIDFSNFNSIDISEKIDDSNLTNLANFKPGINSSDSTALDINQKRLRRSHYVTDPDWKDVTVVSLDPRATMKCGSMTFNYDEIFEAVSWGVLLTNNDPPLGRGERSDQYPNGRFPHAFPDPSFKFNAECPGDDQMRQEYPLFKGEVYNGGPGGNRKWGDYRVVYYREEGVVDDDRNPLTYFCGGLTHEGAVPHSKFLQCTVQLFDD